MDEHQQRHHHPPPPTKVCSRFQHGGPACGLFVWLGTKNTVHFLYAIQLFASEAKHRNDLSSPAIILDAPSTPRDDDEETTTTVRCLKRYKMTFSLVTQEYGTLAPGCVVLARGLHIYRSTSGVWLGGSCLELEPDRNEWLCMFWRGLVSDTRLLETDVTALVHMTTHTTGSGTWTIATDALSMWGDSRAHNDDTSCPALRCEGTLYGSPVVLLSEGDVLRTAWGIYGPPHWARLAPLFMNWPLLDVYAVATPYSNGSTTNRNWTVRAWIGNMDDCIRAVAREISAEEASELMPLKSVTENGGGGGGIDLRYVPERINLSQLDAQFPDEEYRRVHGIRRATVLAVPGVRCWLLPEPRSDIPGLVMAFLPRGLARAHRQQDLF